VFSFKQGRLPSRRNAIPAKTEEQWGDGEYKHTRGYYNRRVQLHVVATIIISAV